MSSLFYSRSVPRSRRLLLSIAESGLKLRALVIGFKNPAKSALSTKAVKFARIDLKDFFDRCRRDPRIVAQQVNGIEFAGWIMVAVIGADHQAVFAGVAQDIGQIVGIFAGHPHVIGGERIARKRFPSTAVAVGQVVQNIRHPLGADLNEAPTDVGKLFRDFFFEKRMKCADHGELEFGKRRIVGEKS